MLGKGSAKPGVIAAVTVELDPALALALPLTGAPCTRVGDGLPCGWWARGWLLDDSVASQQIPANEFSMQTVLVLISVNWRVLLDELGKPGQLRTPRPRTVSTDDVRAPLFEDVVAEER